MNTELYHYGVLGMKWGRRKSNSEIAKKRTDYKIAKNEYKKSKIDFNSAIGREDYNKALKNKSKAYANMAKAEAEYASSKALTTKGANRKKQSIYGQRMSSGTTESFDLRDSLKREKGKDYVDNALKSFKKESYTATAIGGAIGIAGAAYLNRKGFI